MSRVRLLVIALAVLAPLLVLAALVLRPVPAAPQDALLVVVADPTVSEGLVDAIEASGDDTLAPLTATSAELARFAVEQGTIVATLAVDLEAENDVLSIAGANGTQVNQAVVASVADLMSTFDRTVVVQDVNPADVPRLLPSALVAAGLVIGVVTMLARRWGGRLRRSSHPPRHLAERIGTDALLYGVVLGLAAFFAGLPGSPPLWIALGVLLVGLSATVTATCLRALGAWGLGFSVALFALPVWVLVRAPHELLLPPLIAEVGQWMPHGAAAEIAGRMALFGDPATWQPWLVLIAWAVGGALVLALVHRFMRGPARPVEVAAEA
ncbi:hypothetical protein [Aeromicrobium alkaliterrae]|uniref:DUF3533 domain-containing protein n=1 Tax=Aeromicrobium alkaliterrae TaxID=302168 RepID=A0ABN2JGW2_9ACTN